MNKSKSNILEKTALFALVLALLTSVVAFPASVSAASKKKKTIPKSFTNKEACIVKLNTYKLSSLKTYGNKRIDPRVEAVKKYPAKIDKAYAKYEKADDKVISSVDAANALNSKLVGIQKGIDKSLYQRPKVNPHKESLKKEAIDTRTSLEKKKTELDKAKSPEEASASICYVMFDLRVYSYLNAKIKAQLAIDSVQLKVKRNEARYKVVVGTYQRYGSNEKYKKKVSKIAPKIDKLSEPDSDARIQSNTLKTLQKQLDEITIASLNVSPQAAVAGKASLAEVFKNVKGVNKKANSQRPLINSLYKTTLRIFKKKSTISINIIRTSPITEDDVINDTDPDLLSDINAGEDDYPIDENCQEPECF